MELQKNKDFPTIALISVNKWSHSETFIQAQRENLHGKVLYLWGGHSPKGSSDGMLEEIRNSNIAKIKAKAKGYNFENYTLQKYFNYHKVDVVLAQYGTTGATMSKIAKDIGIPTIVHFHGFDAYHLEILKTHKTSYQKMFRQAAAVIAVSRHMKEQLISLGAPRNKVYWLPYGPNSMFYNCQPKFDTLTFITVGRFVDKKAPYLTIAAFKEVLQQFPNARLKMVGGGQFGSVLIETCQNLVHYWGIEDKVDFLGALTHEEVMKQFESSYAFLQHSITPTNGDSEGTPNAVLEASAAGLPIVATRHTGIQDVIVDKETGFLVEERDVESMSKYMIELLKNPEKAREMGQKGRVHVQQNFSMEQYINALDGLIAAIVNKEYYFFQDSVKIILGGGNTSQEGWLLTDINDLNITNVKDWEKILNGKKADRLMAEHVWEHLTEEATEKANQLCFKYLKKRGTLRIAVPDGYFPDPEYIDYVKPGGHGAGADDHKILYTYKTMKEKLEKAGFAVTLLEYWDENGKFHYTDWTDEGGHIRRSRRFDARNQDGALKYTSLIVDAVKL